MSANLQNETIYDISKINKAVYRKSPRFHTHFTASIRRHSPALRSHATMGPATYDPPDPTEFLRRRTGRPAYTSASPDRRRPRSKSMPGVPTAASTTAFIITNTNKNFIVENIKKVKRMKPKVPVKREVIECYGESKPLGAFYSNNKIFTKIPSYLKKFKAQNDRKNLAKKDVECITQPICTYITKEERKELLDGLKKNWEELQQQYQKLPMLTDTIPKKMRKAKLEQELKQLEKDIVTIEKHPYIYIYGDEE